MTSRDFIQLVDQFPNQKIRIGDWVCKWANPRVLKLDPRHPYHEIAQEAIRLKNQLQGNGYSNDLSTYTVENDSYYFDPKFPYILKSIASFEALTNPDNAELIRKLDNRSGTSSSNPAFAICSPLSKIYTYPVDGWKAEKIALGSGALGAAYQLAKETGKLVEFFDQGFRNAYCFDARVSDFQSFSERIITNPDFNVDLVETDPTHRKIGEHYRVFRNLKVNRFCQEKKLNYQQFKDMIDRGLESLKTRAFYQRYCTKDHFAAYLQEKGQPIRERGQPITRAQWEALLVDDEGYWGPKDNVWRRLATRLLT